MKHCLFIIILFAIFTAPLYAGEDAEDKKQELARDLQNPVAELISVPLQNNFDNGLGPEGKGFRYTFKLQPIIPKSLNANWNFILYPLLPYISQHDVIGHTNQQGLGDIDIQAFFSPKNEGPGGILWGAGAIMLLPTATDDNLGLKKWGVGPSGVVLKQLGLWTAGILANHIFSFASAGNDGKNISSTNLQPFLAYTFNSGFNISLSSESIYDWQAKQWTVPVIAGISQIMPVCGHLINLGLSGSYYAQRPEESAKWGLNFTVTFVIPKGPVKSG